MAVLVTDDLDFCDDCMIAACNGDFTGMDDDTVVNVQAGMDRVRAVWGGSIVPSFDSETGEGISEFSWVKCDCCGSSLGGGRHKFAVIK